jgi:hypothetical protein
MYWSLGKHGLKNFEVAFIDTAKSRVGKFQHALLKINEKIYNAVLKMNYDTAC